MSEREQDSCETSADIADEIRRAVESMGDEMPYTVSAGTMRRVADRIKAALRREKAVIEANALAVGGIVEAERHKPGNAAAMRDALRALRDASRDFYNQILNSKYSEILDKYTCVKQGFPAVLDLRSAFPMANAALSANPRKGKWKNGTKYEYEYAYCSECGRMQFAGWDTHKQAKENIESFARDYKFCPGCGAEMEGGVYVQ